MSKKFGAVMSAVLLAACASSSSQYSGSSGKTLLVSQQVWGWYKEYLGEINRVNKGIFVVGIYNGVATSASSFYCPYESCMTANYSKRALDRCRSYSAELECIVFANSSGIVVNYKVEGQ
jgi:hypothetical protein